jgi:hypothetical protein
VLTDGGKMTMDGGRASPPRLALSLDEAAQALGISRDHFERHVLPRVKVTPIGRRKLIAVRELERYLASHAD